MANSTTMRFPDALKSEAQAYADDLGLSLNGLCAVALREYLDQRKAPAKTTAKPVAEPVAAPSPASVESPRQAPAAATAQVPLGEVMRAALPPVKRKSKSRRKR